MKKISYKVWMLALLVGLLGNTTTLVAQTEPRQSRQERIKEHQERIKKILEESKQRREAAEAERAAQQQNAAPQPPGTEPDAQPAGASAANAQPNPAAPPVAARPGQALPTGPVQSAKMTPPVTKGSPTPAAQAPQTARSESRTILLFSPMDSIVSVGEDFQTQLLAETKEGEIDEISVLLKYPRHILNPLALDHSALDPYVKDHIDYEFNPDAGTIYFRAKLEKPYRFAQKPLVSIIWEALEPSDGAAISYQFGEKNKTTGLYLKGSNLLGTLPGADDGVIKTTVQVLGPRTKPTVTQLDNGVIIGARPPKPADDRPGQDITLDLQPAATSLRPGETFDVDVVLNNPGEKRVDRLRLYLQFDPTELEVVDSDLGNVVTRGINIRDANARSEFPFDFYRYNYADNEKGVIVYEVSSSDSQVRGSGKIATIHLKALTNTPRTELVLVKNAEGVTPTTSVSFLGESELGTVATSQAKPLEGVAFEISGRAVANQEADSDTSVYNPFVSNLARRMQSKAD